MGSEDCEGSARIGTECRTAVEAQPADPKQPRANHCQREVMRCEILSAIPVAFADHVGRNQTGNARIEVDDGAAGKIENASMGEETAAPNPMRDRHIHEDEPTRAKP